jgi:hypothetical protein
MSGKCARCGFGTGSFEHFARCLGVEQDVCRNIDRWHGNRCYEAWPVSRFCWCTWCLEAVPSKKQKRRAA